MGRSTKGRQMSTGMEPRRVDQWGMIWYDILYDGEPALGLCEMKGTYPHPKFGISSLSPVNLRCNRSCTLFWDTWDRPVVSHGKLFRLRTLDISPWSWFGVPSYYWEDRKNGHNKWWNTPYAPLKRWWNTYASHAKMMINSNVEMQWL